MRTVIAFLTILSVFPIVRSERVSREISTLRAPGTSRETAESVFKTIDLESLSKEECRVIVKTLLDRAWWDLAGLSIESCRDRDVSSIVFRAASQFSSKMKEMKGLLKKRSTVSISPAYQWAQSGTHLYLSVKLAHKLDAPATLGCEVTHVNVTSTEKAAILRSSVKFRADCKKKRKSFFLTLDLYGELETSEAKWEYASAGRVTLTLPKKDNKSKLWPRLLESPSRKQSGHVWWDMKRKIDAEQKRREDEERKRLEKKKKKAEEAARANSTKVNNQTREEKNTTEIEGKTPKADDPSPKQRKGGESEL